MCDARRPSPPVGVLPAHGRAAAAGHGGRGQLRAAVRRGCEPAGGVRARGGPHLHISYALAGDSVNVSSAVSVFGDAALCAASAAALDVSLFSADQTTFVSCTLDAAGAPWRHFTVYAAGRSNFSDLAFLNGGGTSLDASTGSGGAVASVYVAPNAFNPRMLFTRCSFVGNAAGGGVYGGAVYSSFKCAALRDDPPFCARH